MPICRDGRWHATQEVADACIKHPDDKDFDNLSTQSRKCARTRNASPSQRSGSGDAPSPAQPGPGPPAPSTTSEQPMNPPDDEIHQPTPPNMAPPPVIPQQTAPTRMYPATQPVEAWLENLPTPIPQDNFEDGNVNTPPGDDDEGVHPPDTAPPKYPPYTPPTQTGQGGGDATPPQIAKIVKGIEDGGQGGSVGGRDGDGTPTHLQPNSGKLAPIEDYRPWYANWNARAMARASIAALICGILLSVIVLAGGTRDAERFP